MNIQDAQTRLDNLDLQIIESTFETHKYPFYATTKDGYIVKITKNTITSYKSPHIFYKSNPYTIDNIRHYIKINNINCELLSTEYLGSTQDLLFKDKCGHEFSTSWNSFYCCNKTTCDFCAYSASKSKPVGIDYANELFLNHGYKLLSNDVKSQTFTLEYVCLKHENKGVQKIQWNTFLQGHGCKYCGHEKVGLSKRLDNEEYKRVTENKGLIFKDVVYENGQAFILFECPNHLSKGTQKRKWTNIRKKDDMIGCSYCTSHQNDKNDYVEMLNETHPNIKLIGDYKGLSILSTFKCTSHNHEWVAIPNIVLRQKYACPLCYEENRPYLKFKNHDSFIKEVNEKLPHIEVISQYKGSHELVSVKCKIHNIVTDMSATNLLGSKYACPQCEAIATHKRCALTNDEFIDRLKEVNPDITPLEDYYSNNKKILCRCNVHNYEWRVTPNKLLNRRTGCPKCSSYHNENVMDAIFEKNNWTYEIQKKYNDCKDKKPLPFDRYLVDYNVLIEYDGEQHYQPITYGGYSKEKAIENLRKTQLHDEIKNEYCKIKNIPLIRIPYWEKDNIENYLLSEMKKLSLI